MNTLWPLIRLRLRRDRVQLPVWILSLAFLALLSTSSVTALFGSGAARDSLLRIAVATPAIVMVRGLPQGSDTGALVFFVLFAFLAVMVAFMSTFLAVRHARAEEESGRAELIGATPAGRLTPLIATALYGIGASLLVGVAVALAFLSAGFEPAGSLTCGAALAATGIAFLGVGLLTSQLMRTSRGANGLASALVGLAYVLRAAGDAGGTHSADGLSIASAWPSWLSPIGWGEQTGAFTRNQPTPLLLDLALATVLFVVVVLLQSSRDIDSSVVPARTGRAHAARTLGGSLGLAWRLQRPAIIGWAVAGLLVGLLAGSLGETVVDLTRGNSQFEGALSALSSLAPGERGSIIDLFTAAIFSLIGVVAAAAATQSMVRMRQEEANGSAELLLSTPLRRTRWVLDYLLIGGVAIALVLAAAVAGAAVGLAGAAGTADRVASVAASGLAQLPAALLILAVGAVLFALVPRVSIGLSWAVLLAALFIGQFGGILGLPDWLRDASPFSHSPVVTGTHADWSGGWWMIGIALLLGALVVAAVRRRDLALQN